MVIKHITSITNITHNTQSCHLHGDISIRGYSEPPGKGKLVEAEKQPKDKESKNDVLGVDRYTNQLGLQNGISV